MKRIFGTLNQYFGLFEKGNTLGAFEVIKSFAKGLFSFGSFDEYHLYFYEKEIAKEEIHEKINALLFNEFSLPRAKTDKIKTFFIDDIPANYNECTYDVMHNWDPFFSRVLYSRKNYCHKRYFPIAAFVHAIAPIGMHDVIEKLTLSFTRPYDVFMCPTNPTRSTLKKYFDVISASLNEKFKIKARFNGRFEVLPLGVDSERFMPREKAPIRKELGLPLNRVIALCLTRLTPKNKMELLPLLRSFKDALSRSKNKDLFLVIVGQEQCKGYAKVLIDASQAMGISNNLLLVTNFSNNDVPNYFSASDIFVSPSDNPQESFGLTPIEAMLSGLPVIISDWDGYRDLIIDGVTGFKVPTYWTSCTTEIERMSPLKSPMTTLLGLGQSIAMDNSRMTNLLVLLGDDANKRAEVGNAAREYALKSFSWESLIPKYEKLFFELSEEAKKDKVRIKPKKSDILIPYFDIFKYSASFSLDRKSRFKVSDYGRDALLGTASLFFYELISSFCNLELSNELLNRCKNWSTFDRVLKSYPKQREEDIKRQMMFLLKHGLLECRP